jgi:hypothetical protein
VVVALLVVGNLFCAVCPFTLSRDLAGRLLGRRLRWPPALRNKWLAVALFAVYLWAYEAFSLWDSPWWTAWIVVGYFAACFLVEGLFPRGTFCRYVCPIGSFHFVGAGISPVEVEARDPDVCAGCTSHDCLRGNAAAPGCPTGLFLPTKSGGLDCTLCLDCVRACPHENATLVTLDPGARLGPSPAKHFAGLDVGWLALVFCFGAFVNAAAMVAPLSAWWRGLAAETGASPAIVLGVAFVGALGLVPAVSVWLCGILGRALSGATATPVRLTPAFAPALVPVGFAMWLAHFGFHGVTGIASLGPVAGRAVAGLGLSRGAGPGMAALPDPGLLAALPGLEIAVLGLGLVVSVAVAWRIARGRVASPRAGLGLAAPWMLLATVLYVAGVWIVLQPMQMRGLGTM